MEFIELVNQYKWQDIKQSIYNKTPADVENALNSTKKNIEDFKALVSPAAESYLEKLAIKSQQLTLKRFGKTIQLYIPLYLSNYCDNSCVYCGFNRKNTINRTILNEEQILKEVEIIKSYGYKHVLLVTGESSKADASYLQQTIKLIKNHFSHISIEVQPLSQLEYERLISEGLNTVYLYQETYSQENYSNYHPAGKKSSFKYRLDSYERLGRAGIHKIGLGTLLGLEDWRTESFFLALHIQYMRKTYWKTKYSISFPRLRPHTGNFNPPNPVSEKELVQLICAYRIFDEDIEISLSTRESPYFRDNVLALGITSISAGSSTEPGGYANNLNALCQFQINDDRSPIAIAEMIKSKGYEVVWKDWDVFMQKQF